MSDTISRWAAVAALEAYLTPYRGTIDTGSIHRNGVIGDVISAIRALPAAPAPQPWTEGALISALTRTEMNRYQAERVALIVLAGPGGGE